MSQIPQASRPGIQNSQGMLPPAAQPFAANPIAIAAQSISAFAADLKRVETICLGVAHEHQNDMQAISQYVKNIESNVSAMLHDFQNELARLRTELDALAPVETPPPPRRARRTPSEASEVRQRALPEGDLAPRDGRADMVMDMPDKIDGRFPPPK